MIIGLIGPARCGKSTVASHLVNRYGFIERSFAAPLKEMVVKAMIANPPPGWEMRTPQEIERSIYHDRTPLTRWLLQWVGTDIFRDQVSETFWVEREREYLTNETKDVVYADVRFKNEARIIQFVGGHIIRIQRPNMSYTDGIEHGATHASETELQEIHDDATLVADEGIHHLHNVTDQFMERMKYEGIYRGNS